MPTGLSETGFEVKTEDKILSDINSAVQQVFAVANTNPESVFGQYNGILADALADLWAFAALIYNSQYPSSAIGVSLDRIVALNGLERLPATPSTCVCVVEGVEGTVVPTDTEFSQIGTLEIFKTLIDTTITKTNQLKTVISAPFPSSPPHTITITSQAGVDVYSTAISTSAADILNALASQINGSTTHTAVVDLVALQLTILPVLPFDVYEILIGGGLLLDEIWTPIVTESESVGAIAVPSNSIINISSPVVGLNQVNNLSEGTIGRDTETDTQLRVRRKQSLQILGAATVPAIEARLLQEISNVTSVLVKENRTDTVDIYGRPPHSFEAIVSYPVGDTVTEQEIAELLWRIKAAGIQTYGNVTKSVIDSTNTIQAISFSRPVDKYIHVDVQISLYNEEVFPSDGIEAIKQAILEYGNSLAAGKDVLYQRFYNAIYSVQGVKDIVSYNQAVTRLATDTPAVFYYGVLTNVYDVIKLEDSLAYFLGSNVVSGMAIENVTTPAIRTITLIPNETTLYIDEAGFSAGDSYEIGGLKQYDISIQDNELPLFALDRITVTVV